MLAGHAGAGRTGHRRVERHRPRRGRHARGPRGARDGGGPAGRPAGGARRRDRGRGVDVDTVWRERAASYAAGRVPTAQEVADTIAWLASDAASGVSGETVAVSLGDPW